METKREQEGFVWTLTNLKQRTEQLLSKWVKVCVWFDLLDCIVGFSLLAGGCWVNSRATHYVLSLTVISFLFYYS